MANTQIPLGGSDEDYGETLFRLSDSSFAANPAPRTPCLLVLDVSKSMAGERIEALNEGLLAFHHDVNTNPIARQRVEIGIVEFGTEVRVTQDFVTVDDWPPPVLKAGGQTPLGSAILKALDLIEDRKARYRANGISYQCPWIFLITDGAPQGEPIEVVREAVRRLRVEEAAKRVAFFAVGVEGANMKFLAKLSGRPPRLLKGLQFNQPFVWLSASVQQVAHSGLGVPVALPAADWGTV